MRTHFHATAVLLVQVVFLNKAQRTLQIAILYGLKGTGSYYGIHMFILILFRVTGGELFEDIVAREYYSEADARLVSLHNGNECFYIYIPLLILHTVLT